MIDILDEMSAFLSTVPQDEQLHFFLDRQLSAGNAAAWNLLRERASYLTEHDRKRASPYTVIGHFKTLDSEERLAAWLLALEMGQMHGFIKLKERFARYEADQPLFRALPKLINRSYDNELIAYSPDHLVRHDGVIRWDKRYVQLDPYLNPLVVASLASSFPSAPLYVRLHPQFVTEDPPREYLTEEILVPADPTWWSSLGIYPGNAKGSHYALPCTTTLGDDLQVFWDYRVRGVRSLEVHAMRRQAGYLSMMVEELVDLRDTSGYVLGRCIHWDTEAPKGTPPDAALVKHLDLAINVYSGSAAEARLVQSLSNGRVADATFRTHILRIEGIPAQVLVHLASQFFISKTLLSEWLEDQFNRKEE